MPPQWISAEKAREIVAEVNGNRLAEFAICRLAHMGTLKARARLIKSGGALSREALIPKEFWWAEGNEALKQDWAIGDFETWLDQRYQIQASGVEFDFTDLREVLQPERAAVVARELSVAGNPDWMTAIAARRFIYDSLGHNPASAGALLIEQCRLGFVAARAVVWQQISKDGNGEAWQLEERERDIPTWFWDEFCSAGASEQDWASGKFSGRGVSPKGYCAITISAVHFARASLEAMLPKKPGDLPSTREEAFQKSDVIARHELPPLSEGALGRWWKLKEGVREGLSQDEIGALLSAAFPDNFVSRDRIRQLTGTRKRGPKPIPPKSVAK